MKVPLLDLEAQHSPLAVELKSAFERVLSSNGFILGPEVESLEKTSADYLGIKHAIGVSSGTDALILPLMALGIQPGDEILCPSFTFFGTAGVIARLGAVPVFVDIDEDDFNISIEDLKNKITDKTKAIIPVHLFGQSANMTALQAIANEHGLYVVEDVAQAMGAIHEGQQVGSFGDFGCYSFFPTKNLGAFGDAGLVATNNDELAKKISIMRVHGGHPKYFHKYVGGNFRIDALQAALLNVKFPHMDSYIQQRRENASYYLTHFKEIEDSSILILPRELDGNFHTWNQFTIRVIGEGKRDALKQYLWDHGIASEIYYPLPLHEQECFQGISKGAETITVSSQVSKECLSLPIYPGIKELQLAYVVDTVKAFLKG